MFVTGESGDSEESVLTQGQQVAVGVVAGVKGVKQGTPFWNPHGGTADDIDGRAVARQSDLALTVTPRLSAMPSRA